ncbi:MAG: class I SAM-dependent methyltransferase [Promethearchaeota archaeon]
MSDEEKYNVLAKQSIMVEDFACGPGWILDFGGGGEGIIGQTKGDHVIAIDRLASELEEALERNCPALPVVMDGTDLKFVDGTFNTATAFFSLMFVKDPQDLEKIFSEIFRVLKPGGLFYIWDVEFSNSIHSSKPVTVFHLSVTLPSGTVVETGYGTKREKQKMQSFLTLGEQTGFKIKESQREGDLFTVILQK